MEEILKKARSEFHNRLRIEGKAIPEKIAKEVAKNNIPSSSKELLLLAARNLELALEVPVSGPAFDGRTTAVNVIAANVAENIYMALTAPQVSTRKLFEALSARIGRIATAHELESALEFSHTENLYRKSSGNDGDA
jgi:hypothetical protein